MKDKYLKSSPKSKALFKLALWAVFFAVLFIIASFSNLDNYENNNNENNNHPSYLTIKNKLMESNLLIKVKVTKSDGETLIDGKYIDNIMEGTIENLNGVFKFKIKENNLYELKMNEEIIRNDLMEEINVSYLNPQALFAIFEESEYLKYPNNDGFKYSYVNNNVAITVYTDIDRIEKIIILDENITYEIEYLIIE